MSVPDGFKVSEVGVIPEDWDVKKLESVSTLSSGTTPSRQLQDRYFSKGTINWVKTTDLNNSNITQTEEKVTELALYETCLKEYDVDTVLVAMYGGFNQIGRTGLLKIPATVNQALIAIQSKSNLLNPVFLINYLNFRVSYWKNVAISSRKDPNITSRDVKNFPIPLPPLAEQKAIAQSLSDVDNLITAIDKLITKKRNIKQGTMQELLTGKKPLPGFSGEWEVKKFDDITKLITCGLAATPKYVREEIGKPFLSAQNVRNGKVIYDNYKYISHELFNQITKYSKPQKGDLLYTRVGAGIGEAGIIEDDFEFGIYVSLTLIRTNEKELHNYFLLHLLNSYTYKSLAKNGQFAGGGVQNLNVQIVKEFLIPLPPIPEQKAIAKILTEMDEEIEALEKKREKYKNIKQGMMQELLTGKTRIIDN